MSKRQFKSHASSSRAPASIAGGGFGAFSTASASSLSYLTEPPSLTAVTDANVVVAFKNLLKKDSTTKSKGLEDLRAYVQAHPFEKDGGTEQPILDAWVKIYPRLSIDNSRRVRELSHTLQYELLKSARKRMEKHIPTVVGAWLAGTFDRDRPVSRAAADGIASFLDTDSKINAFWSKCQDQVLLYAQNAIEETPHTLSDERGVSEDDMQAKYDRVIGSSLLLVVSLLRKVSAKDISKGQDGYTAFLTRSKPIWAFIHESDSFVRKATAQLLLLCLDKEPNLIESELESISSEVIAEGLRGSQASSATQLLEALIKLTSQYPSVWTTSYRSKRPAVSRLRNFVQKGSQGGSAEYWHNLNLLLTSLPNGVLPNDHQGCKEFLEALRDGAGHREEPRSNANAAWDCYFGLIKHFKTMIVDSTVFEKLLADVLYPGFEHFMFPTPGKSQWPFWGSAAPAADAFMFCAQTDLEGSNGNLKAEWTKLAELIVTKIFTSSPEQSQNYAKSQSTVELECRRWFNLHAEILNRGNAYAKGVPDNIHGIIGPPCSLIVERSIEILAKRIGKPYGAASAIDAALRLTPAVITTSPDLETSIATFFENQLPTLITSPSASYLLSSLNNFRHFNNREDFFQNVWRSALIELLKTSETSPKKSVVRSLISCPRTGELSQIDEDLQAYLLETVPLALGGDIEALAVVETAISFDCYSKTSWENIIQFIMEELQQETPQATFALQVLEALTRKKSNFWHNREKERVNLMTRLLALTESSNSDIVARVNNLNLVFGKDMQNPESEDKYDSILLVIRDNLENATSQSLSIDILVSQAISYAGNTVSIALFPDTEKWFAALKPLLEQIPNPSLSLTNILGGAISLVEGHQGHVSVRPMRDVQGFSIALRMAMYTQKLLSFTGTDLNNISVDAQQEIMRLLWITVEIASDQLGLLEDNKLWATLSKSSIGSEIQDFLSASQLYMNELLSRGPAWRGTLTDGHSKTVQQLVLELIYASAGNSPFAYYSARVLSKILSTLIELHGWQNKGLEDWLVSLDILKTSTSNIFAAVAILAGLKESLASSKLVSNLSNRLLSDITGISYIEERSLGLLVFLNACLSVYETNNLPIAQNRLVFAVKQITSWLSLKDALDSPVATECSRSLSFLLPSIKELYGSYWEATIEFCISVWTVQKNPPKPDHAVSSIHATLCLIAGLKDIEGKNEDFEEALTTKAESLSCGLLGLLEFPRKKETQPWLIADGILSRQISKIPLKHVKDLSKIYPLVASEFRPVQHAALDVLHRAIPAAQEQVSVDVLLEKRDAHLPEELLSLLLNAPSHHDFTDEDLAIFPSSIRSYLFSWLLIFDSFTNASHKVRSDHTETLRSDNYITPLLNFLTDALGHSIASPLNLEKAHMGSDHVLVYDLGLASSETDERNMQWLLVHIYYLCLKLVPGLVKNWWIDCKSKQTRLAVESWTKRYYSDLLIQDALEEVTKWSEEQKSSDDEKELVIKISKKTREVYAGCEVDEMMMQIAIRLSEVYPLEGVKVDGINRVAVTEKKWQSWLLITQGVITFSNGSIIDGLAAFRKNVTGALKGQTECAICYSIVSSDKKMPDKKCQTCKNLFHSNCLFKWFASSNQSTCPLCRNPFNYGTDVANRSRRRASPEPGA